MFFPFFSCRKKLRKKLLESENDDYKLLKFSNSLESIIYEKDVVLK